MKIGEFFAMMFFWYGIGLLNGSIGGTLPFILGVLFLILGIKLTFIMCWYEGKLKDGK